MRTEVAIVGAGPAALAAADTLAAFPLEVTLIDEQPRPGGQIYRQPPAQFRVPAWLPERLYRQGKSLLARVSSREGLHWKLGTTVLGITGSRETVAGEPTPLRHELLLAGHGGAERLQAQQVLIATGCHDMSVGFPGSTLPGVMATGGIQALVKSQQLVPGERFAFVGTHPLQLIVADQVRRAGGDVAEVIFAQTPAQVVRVSAGLGALLGYGGELAYFAAVLLRLKRAGVRLRFGETVIGASGDSSLSGITVARTDASGRIHRDLRREIRCDRLGVCFGFLASSELARQVGVECAWLADGGGWVSRCDDWMGTNVPGVFVAGEITAVAGADSAMEQGRLAALGMLRERGLLDSQQSQNAAAPIRRRLHRRRQFAQFLRRICAPQWRLLEGMLTADSTLCKCEEIPLARFSSFVADNPTVASANAAKLGCRVGMGLCQGRYCNYYVTRLLAQARGLEESQVGPFTAQWPVKPVTIGDLVAADRKAL